ncbi:hypothetical protein HPB52_024093 [Rhipicephalus sanguineus]|uniref:Secreted protein n=1 Tax=Rhipicephalus sanguineus TaxID=34632 RepID=A0A9D4QET6_RHISA|nr:hypothetical protein HPB52_024093 [Rhipicephalus sanguineus]
MESRRTYARKETAVVVTVAFTLIASLSAASGQEIDGCDPSSAKKCYLKYRFAIWWGTRDGVYDEEEFKRGCSRIKAKIPCHEYLADCPEPVNGDYQIQERGYEAISNIVCDSKILKDFLVGFQCRDDNKLDECAKAMSPAADPQNPRVIVDDEDYCRRFKAKIPCHEYLADCPEVVNGDYRIQERGYEAMSNIVCDSKILKDFHVGYHWLDQKKMDECAKAMSPAADPRNPRVIVDNEDYCRLRNIEIACFEQALNSSCPLPLKTAKTALTRVLDAISQLAGCPSSAHAAMASKGFIVLLVTPVILSWLRT